MTPDRGGGRAAPSPILYVHSGLDWITGSERCLLDLIAHLDRARFTPVVWANAPAVRAAAAELGATVYESPYFAAHRGLLPPRAHVREARSIVRRHGIRLIHANDAEPLRVLVPVARGERLPLLAHLHLRLTSDERRWSLVHQVSLAVGVSEAAVRGLRDDGFAPDRTAVIYNAVDRDRLARGDATGLRAELGIPSNAVVFAVVGSLIQRKAVDVVLGAFRLLGERRDDCRLLICGDGPLDDELRARADAEGVAGSVRFLGRRPDVGAILRDAADVLVSAAWEESFGLNLVEAAVFGVPSIASAIDAHTEIMRQGIAGVPFPAGDSRALADAMDALASDPARRRALGDAARKHAEESFLVGRYVAEFERAYAGLLAEPPSAYGWRCGSSWPRAYTRWVAGVPARRVRRLLG